MLWHRNEDQLRGCVEGQHADSATGSTAAGRGSVMPSGLHHVALICRDMETTVAWYEKTLVS